MTAALGGATRDIVSSHDETRAFLALAKLTK
jgi:hypothetical protein